MARGGGQHPEPGQKGQERPVGDLVEQLVDDGKAYARAEATLVRAKLEHRIASYRSAAILGGVAALLATGAAIALSLTLVLSLASLVGPLAGGLIATLLVGGAAALVGYFAKKAFATVPMIEQHKVALAEVEVDRTRSKLMATVAELAERLEPRKIMDEVWESAKNKGADFAEDAVDAVRSRPVAVGGVLAAITMFLAREPIKDAAVKLYGAMTSSDEPETPAPALKKDIAKPPARRARRASAAPRKKVEKA